MSASELQFQAKLPQREPQGLRTHDSIWEKALSPVALLLLGWRGMSTPEVSPGRWPQDLWLLPEGSPALLPRRRPQMVPGS